MGLPMLPLVIQIERTLERKADTCAFAQSPVRIGRNALNDLQLDESFVSQWHGVIRFDEKHATYVDLGSTNPTFIDGAAAPRNVEIPLTENTDFRIGSLRLHLMRGEAPPELFGARRKSAFARTGEASEGVVAKTMYLPEGSPPSAAAAPTIGQSGRPPAVAQPVMQAPHVSHGVAPAGAPAGAHAGAHGAGRPLAGSSSKGSGDTAVRESYAAYRSAWNTLLMQLRTQLSLASPAEREMLLAQLSREYPEIGHERQLRNLLSELGISPLLTGVPEMEDWLSRLTGGMFPLPGVAVNVALAMERMGEVLEVFASAFVELRKAQSQFCEEMALEKLDDESLLLSTDNPRVVLAYLLNPGLEGSGKVNELSRAMADFAVHQVALVSAVVQGARDLLEELSPETFSQGQGTEAQEGGFFGKLLSGQKNKLWERYAVLFADVVDEDRFTRKLFGRGFARKYYAITGGRRSLPAPPPPNASARPKAAR